MELGDEGMLERLSGIFADCLSEDTPSVRFAKILGVSTSSADAILSGQKPITARMLFKVNAATNISIDWLLTGKGRPERSLDTHDAKIEESQFLSAFRNASPDRQRYAAFVITFDDVLGRLPREICLRVLGGLVPFAQLETNDWLRNAIGRNAIRLGIDVKDLMEYDQIFTPVHEVSGVYGPEVNGSLDSWLENRT